VYRDFYATMAQVLPVVLLALIWDSKYLERLEGETRGKRGSGAADEVWFWLKERVRVFTIALTGLLVASLSTCLLFMAGVVGDADWLRVLLVGVLILALATLFVHITVAVLRATR
jgi:hypothetical protein